MKILIIMNFQFSICVICSPIWTAQMKIVFTEASLFASQLHPVRRV